MMALLQHPLAQALAKALGHFLWQGALIALVPLLLGRWLPLSAKARYIVGIACLVAMILAPIMTTAYLVDENPTPVLTATGATLSTRAPETALPVTLSVVPDRRPGTAPGVSAGPAVLLVWIVGVIVLSMRLCGGWFVARRIVRRASHPTSAEIRALAQRVAGRLALDRLVDVLESARIAVPAMVGWMKPVILLPTAAVAGLSPAQIEALVAHELAHVYRHDYLVNLLQSAVETLLFYHPGVWWVSHEVREAREECCDDLAVGVCDRLVYATALADLATMTGVPSVALAATGGSLVTRVRRILGEPAATPRPSAGWLGTVLTVGAAGLVVSGVFAAQGRPSDPVPVATTVVVPEPAPILEAATAQAVSPLRATTSSTPETVPSQDVNERLRTSVAVTAAQTDLRSQDLTAKLAELEDARQLAERRIEDIRRMVELRRQQMLRELAVAHEQSQQVEAELRATEEALEKAKQEQSAGEAAVDGARLDGLQQVLKDLEVSQWQLRGQMSSGELDQPLTAQRDELATAQSNLSRFENEIRDFKDVAAGAGRSGGPDGGAADNLLLLNFVQSGSQDILVVGEVVKPSVIAWRTGLTVDQAIQAAGGQTPAGSRIVRFSQVHVNGSDASNFVVGKNDGLHPGDVITVTRK
jgi:beta-lactamase regulating signal transducer with metallopeptidase domain